MAGPAVRFRIDFAEHSGLGPGEIFLLEAIRDAGSLLQGARNMGISYRGARLLPDSLRQSFRERSLRSDRMQATKAERGYRYGLIGVLSLLLSTLSGHPSRASDAATSGGNPAGANSISIDGAVEHPRSLTVADLKIEPATTEAVSQRTGKGVLTGSYTGVLLWTLLQKAVIKVTGSRNDVMRHTITVTSSDGYATVLSVAEIDPEFGDEQAIIAYAKDGKPLADKRGFARLIVPADKSAGRAISGVASITVR
jgi:Oxidoreductase molybdopterin binding domain